MAALKVLAVAVASSRAGYILMQGTQVIDWGITVKAARNSSDLVGFVQSLINQLKPDVLVTERCDAGSKKGRNTRKLIAAIAAIASQNYLMDVAVPRPRRFPSKYEEATDAVSRHPELIGYLPRQKRRLFDYEPRAMILFEALALAERVITSGPPRPAAA